MDGPPPGQPAGGFRPLAPPDRPQPGAQPQPPPARPQLPAPQPLPPREPAPKAPAPPKEEAPKPKPAERRPAELPPAPRPEPDPKDENARQVALGQAAFAAGQYGRAAHHFREAIVVAPGEPQAHFLLAQSLFALGKYRDAAAAIHEGLGLQADWPTRAFRPLELYGDNVADYPEHLARLEEAVGRNPNDPVLLFLYGYQLWFDGRQEEAAPLFQRAARLAPDPADSLRFLRALPPGVPMI
jgi:tetratricopeptide (TPR) repeat protein